MIVLDDMEGYRKTLEPLPDIDLHKLLREVDADIAAHDQQVAEWMSAHPEINPYVRQSEDALSQMARAVHHIRVKRNAIMREFDRRKDAGGQESSVTAESEAEANYGRVDKLGRHIPTEYERTEVYPQIIELYRIFKDEGRFKSETDIFKELARKSRVNFGRSMTPGSIRGIVQRAQKRSRRR